MRLPLDCRFCESGSVHFHVVRNWMEDSLKGLCHLHNGSVTPILLRDIKPSNLLVFSVPSDSNRPYRVKLGGLGLSKSLPLGSSFASARGTPYYMPPEWLDGRYCTASDMFSWGITMCEVIVQAMGGVVDVMQRYSDDRDGLVEAALALLGRHSPVLADLLRSCYVMEYAARPSAADALSVVMASRGSTPLNRPLVVSAAVPEEATPPRPPKDLVSPTVTIPPQLMQFVLDASLLEIDEAAQLGSGSYGVVWKGRYDASPVCVKVSVRRRARDPELVVGHRFFSPVPQC